MRIPPALLVLLAFLAAGRAAYGASAEAICQTPAAIFCDDFEAGSFDMWQDGYSPSVHAITTVPANVYRGQKALQATYLGGSNGAGWLTRWFMPGFDHTFARAYVKFEPGWQCSGGACSKLFVFYGNRVDNQWSGFGQAGVCPKGTDYYYAGVATLPWYVQPDPGEVILYSYYPGMPTQPDGQTCWGAFGFLDDPRTALQTGVWHCLEVEVQANTPGARDGFQRVWVDGALKREMLNMRWRDTTDVRTNAFQLSFSGSPGTTEHVWVDNVVVSTQRIGCVSAGTPLAAPTDLRVQ